MSLKPEVARSTEGPWTPNGLRFATEDEALRWARDLRMRWLSPECNEVRATESEDAVNARLDADGTTHHL